MLNIIDGRLQNYCENHAICTSVSVLRQSGSNQNELRLTDSKCVSLVTENSTKIAHVSPSVRDTQLHAISRSSATLLQASECNAAIFNVVLKNVKVVM